MADYDQTGETGEAQEQPFGHFAPDAPFDPALIAPNQYEEEVEAAPDDAGDEPETDEPDYKALAAEREAELERLRKQSEEYEAQQEAIRQQQFQQAQKEWYEEAQRAYAHAETLPHREAVAFLAQFQQQRENSLLHSYGQVLTEKEAIKYEQKARKLVSEHGLPEDEVETLVRAATIAGKPDAMNAEAQRLKARYTPQNQELQQLRKRIAQLEAAETRKQLGSALRVGQGNRSVPSKAKPGTREQLAGLLGIPQ